jgi:tricorn protease
LDAARTFAIWTPEDGWVVENVGVPPDIEVEMSPAAVIAGHDPQLENSVEVLMADLTKNPPLRPKRPAYPSKAMP